MDPCSQDILAWVEKSCKWDEQIKMKRDRDWARQQQQKFREEQEQIQDCHVHQGPKRSAKVRLLRRCSRAAPLLPCSRAEADFVMCNPRRILRAS